MGVDVNEDEVVGPKSRVVVGCFREVDLADWSRARCLIITDRSRAFLVVCIADRNRAGCRVIEREVELTINRRWGGNDEDDGGVGMR